MPNYCVNELYVRCQDEQQLQAFLSAISCAQSAVDFRRLAPEPEKITEGSRLLTEKHRREFGGPTQGVALMTDEMVDWRRAHWGTKWNAIEARVERNGSCDAVIRFQTAWAPPLPWFDKLLEASPDVTLCLEYFERGSCFSGGVCRSFSDEDPAIRRWESKYYGLKGG